MDYYWIDAEWFGKGPWWKNPGNWEVKRDLYPQGFKPISDLLHSAGRKFLLWFEPERVCAGTPWYTEHAEWLLEVPKDKKVYRGFDAKGEWDVAQVRPALGAQRKRAQPDSGRRQAVQSGDSGGARSFSPILSPPRSMSLAWIASGTTPISRRWSSGAPPTRPTGRA